MNSRGEKRTREIRMEDHVHDWDDRDEVTVKELREARIRLVRRDNSSNYSTSDLLQDISEHRENFGEKSVVQDPEGNIWKLRRGSWLIFGGGMTVGYDIPRRPLKLLGTDARRD